jgi:hypothetical protein
MTLPHLMSKIWDGDEREYFTWLDMNRVEYNANIMAKEAGMAEETFQEVTRASQFRYDEAQKLEMLIADMAEEVGVDVETERSWGYNRLLSYVDFERWESSLWKIYQALGGIGERIPAGNVLVTYQARLAPSAWRGVGPFTMDLDMPGIYLSSEVLAYVPHFATMEQRRAEAMGILRVSTVADRRVRVTALGVKPAVTIPINFSVDGLPMQEVISLSASGWTGSGPWVQTVTMTGTPANAVLGMTEDMTDEAVEAMSLAGLCVSAVSGNQVTIRAMFDKPAIALNPTIMWEPSASE